MMKRYVDTIVLVIAVIVLASGCNLSGDPQRMIAKAQEYRVNRDYKSAIIELKNVLQKNPNHAEARYLLGITYNSSGEYQLAEQELRRALQLSFERSKVMPALGRSMLMLGEFKKVLDQVPLEGYTSNAVQADILTLRARALIGLGKRNEAKPLLEQALAKQSEFADALVELARLAGADLKLDESARLIERAIASEPKHVDAWLMKSHLASVKADQAGALAANQKILEIDPMNVSARLNIISLHIANNKLDEARKLIAQTRSLAPANVMAVHMQALVSFQTRDYKAANEDIQKVLKVAPDFLPSVLLAGNILAALGSHEQAQANYVRVLDKMPGNLIVRKSLISSLASSGQFERAKEVVQQGLRRGPEDSSLLMMAGELYMRSGEFAKASGYFDAATKRDPKSAVARAQLGVSRMATGDADRAFADLESAAELDTDKHQADLVLIASYMKAGKNDQALRAMDALEKKQPNSPSNQVLKAAIYILKKDVPNARKALQRSLEIQPTLVVAAQNLALLDIQEKKPKEARRWLESILEKDKNNVQALLTLADLGAALEATKKEQIDWLERAIKAAPGSVHPKLLLARLYVTTGDMKKALEVAQQAQSTNPDDQQALELVAAIQTRTGQNAQAVTTYAKLAQLQPKSPATLYRLASAQANNADFAAAEGTLRQVLSLKPDFLDASVALVGLELRAGRYQDATRTAQQVQKQDAKSPIGFALEADILLAEKKYPQAIKLYETVHGMAKNAASLIKLHMAYVAAGKDDEGDARVAHWLKTSPNDVVVKMHAAETALRRGRYKEAIAHYEWLQQKRPDDVAILNNLAWAYQQVKDARAIEFAERAYKLAPDSSSIVDTLGWLLIERGDTKRGVELVEKAAKAAPKNPVIGYHLAQGWLKAGDKSKARKELERLLALEVKFAQQAEAQQLLKDLSK